MITVNKNALLDVINPTEHYSAITKNEILPSALAWRDLEGIIPSEISQRHKHYVFSLTERI